MVCESMAKCTLQMDTIILNLSQILTNQKRSKSHVQYVINIDDKMCDVKLLS